MTSAKNVKGFPVQIVETKGDKLHLKEKELEKILIQPQLKDKPVMVLSIAGIFRSGKSFLLNLLISYLSQGCSGSWMEDQNSKLEGFESCTGTERVTTGIWIWSEVFFIGADGKNIGVVLMDTQGTQDSKTSTKLNASVFALSTLMSTIQIYNVKTNIDEGDLQFLQQIIYFGIAIKGDNKTPFQTLLFFVRDWQNPTQYDFGKDGGRKYLAKYMEICSEGQSKENQDLRKSIVEVFAGIKCFLMPRPGNAICEGTGSGHLKDIDERFQLRMKELVKILFLSETFQVKRIDGEDLTCENIVKYFKHYVQKVGEEKFEIHSLAEANAIAHEREVDNDVMERFFTYMDKLCENYQENLNELYLQRQLQALDEFKGKCGLNPSNQCGDIQNEMRKKIENRMQRYFTENNRIEENARLKNCKHMEYALRDFETKMDQKCSSYMEETMLKNEFEQQKEQALEYFRKNGINIGPSYSEYNQQLEENINKKYSDYQAKMKANARCLELKQVAMKLFTTEMDQKCSSYMEATMLKSEFEKQKRQAVEHFRENGKEVGSYYYECIQQLEENITKMYSVYQAKMDDLKENAERKNKAAYEEALEYYKNKLDKHHMGTGFEVLHTETQREAEIRYEENSVDGFPSYEEKKDDLRKEIGDQHNEYISDRHFLNRALYYTMNVVLFIPRKVANCK